ncbi:hypothetical protein L218DRAFT_965961 [Marasmius fiardii PR-910]|nr:hypothetical protein L218DRAFT_965961 [Marasmius fiardii PR-910]
MKFFASPAFLTVIAAVTSTAVAQQTRIATPRNNTYVRSDQDLLIEVNTIKYDPNTTQVGLVIGLANCDSEGPGCVPPSEGGIGTILYNGPFNPTFSDEWLPAHQNYTVKIPDEFKKGRAQISTTQFALVGESLIPSTFYDMIYVELV